MKNTFCALFLALSILTFCASGVTVVVTPPPGSTVTVRYRPSLTAPSITTVPYGAYDAICQTIGETVANPTGTSSNVWYRLPIYNGFVAGAFVWVPPGQWIPWCRRPPIPPRPPIRPPDIPVVGIAVAGAPPGP